jgi:hypothetical protein
MKQINLTRRSLLLLAALSCGLAPHAISATVGGDLEQLGKITLNPATGPVVLTLQGPAYQGAASWGFTLSYHDYDATANVASGIFKLYRPVGQYQWQLSTATGGDRLAMQLGNDHVLKVTNPTNASQTIELRPGLSTDATKGVFFNGQKLVGANSPSLVLGSNSAVGSGLLAAGNNARAMGQSSFALGDFAYTAPSAWSAVAVGYSSRANNGSMALGTYASSDGQYSTAAGYSATASGNYAIALGFAATASDDYAMALGNFAYANGYATTALGPNSDARGSCSIALGSCSYASGNYSAVLGQGWAYGDCSVATGWGYSLGYASISLGGDAEGYKAFAANSGTAWADYSTAIGSGTNAYIPCQVVVGLWNECLAEQNLFYTFSGDAPPLDFPIFVVGNGYETGEYQEATGDYAIHSNALTVAYNGDTWIQGGITVQGTGREGNGHVASTFVSDVNVQGVIRVNQAGDLSMGGFANGPTP